MSGLDRYGYRANAPARIAKVIPAQDGVDGAFGALLGSHMPEDPSRSDIAQRVWKIILRRWWSAWSDGLCVLEPRRWWFESGRLWCWAVSSSKTPLRQVSSAEVRNSEQLVSTVAALHARGLPHGGLLDGYALTGSEGELVAPPTLDVILSSSDDERQKRDLTCVGANGSRSRHSKSWPSTALELLVTLQGEVVSAFEMVYPFTLKEKDDGKSGSSHDLTIILDRTQPHPVLGQLSRASAAELFEDLLRESEGGRLELIANDSPDPFEYEGRSAIILSSPEDDEDALVIRPLTFKPPFPARGWVRPRSEGSRALVERKWAVLEKASQRRHILSWFGGTPQPTPKLSRETLTAAIVENEGVFCVQGPPGTGKTYLACAVVVELLARDPHARVLVCAKEHNALHLLRDQVLARVGPSPPQHSTVERATDPSDPTVVTTDSTFSSAWAQDVVRSQPPKTAPSRWLEALKRWNGQAPPILARIHQKSSQLLFTTTTAAAVQEDLLSPTSEPFDLVVVEEAGKCYPSELLSVLAQSRSALLIGDQRQLPPFQSTEVSGALDDVERIWGEDEGRLRLLDHNPGLFEKVGAAPDFSWGKVRDFLLPFKQLQEAGRPSFMLSDQYRMVPVLSDMVSSIFYPRAFTHRRPPEACSPLFHHPAFGGSPLVWIDTPHSRTEPRAREDRTGERFSEIELSTVATVIREVVPADGSTGSIAILSPYNAQVDRLAGRHGIPSRLQANTESLGNMDPRSTVKTVDSFQGNEADLVIVSLVRNNPYGTARNAWGFLVNPERLNVMFSRARRQLVIVGCAEHVRRHAADPEMKYLAAVLQYVEKHGTITSVDRLGVRV